MIITVTLNPSIDRTLYLSHLEKGLINRVNTVQVDPGGKGVNVSRALKAYGAKTYAILVGGGLSGKWLSTALDEQHIRHKILTTSNPIRTNLTIVEANGEVTKINEPGSPLEENTLKELKKSISRSWLKKNWVVLAGQPSPETSENVYPELVAFAKSKGALVAVDASGEVLAKLLKEVKPDLIKPNQQELSTLVGYPINTIRQAVDACKNIVADGVKKVLCSLGPDGAIAVDENSVTFAEPTRQVQGIPVGAGDILLAIYLAAGMNSEALQEAVKWSAASVALPGTAIPTFEQANKIEVILNKDIDFQRELEDAS